MGNNRPPLPPPVPLDPGVVHAGRWVFFAATALVVLAALFGIAILLFGGPPGAAGEGVAPS